MDTPQYVYPGSFCPPTVGHHNIVVRAAEQFPHLTVVCSRNPEKTNDWFTAQEVVSLWQGYALPSNVEVVTLEQQLAQRHKAGSVVMIRGLRHAADLAHEQRVMELNHHQFGISTYCYLLAEDGWQDVSSTAARQAAANLDLGQLARLVAPQVTTSLLKRAHGWEVIYLVVGRPGSGKSTWIQQQVDTNPRCVHINTDEFGKELQPLLADQFPGQDLVELALEHESELLAVIAKPWLGLLAQRLRDVPRGSTVYVEAAYGLQPSKHLYDFVGGDVLYVDCPRATSLRRNAARGTPAFAPFTDVIPDWEASKRIANEHHLQLQRVDTTQEREVSHG